MHTGVTYDTLQLAAHPDDRREHVPLMDQSKPIPECENTRLRWHTTARKKTEGSGSTGWTVMVLPIVFSDWLIVTVYMVILYDRQRSGNVVLAASRCCWYICGHAFL